MFVSLETPVVYFYSDKETTASLRVDFPEGTMTDWYPQATRPPQPRYRMDQLHGSPAHDHDVATCRRTRIRNRTEPLLRRPRGRCLADFPGRLAARGKLEHEKFLFYRGVGDGRMPVRVKALGNNQFIVLNDGKEAIPAFVFVQIRDGKIRFEKHGQSVAEIDAQGHRTWRRRRPAKAESWPSCFTRLLIEQGLFEKEARAMVKTWQSDWFGQEGRRVLYLVPAAVTEGFLPMKVTPETWRSHWSACSSAGMTC